MGRVGEGVGEGVSLFEAQYLLENWFKGKTRGNHPFGSSPLRYTMHPFYDLNVSQRRLPNGCENHSKGSHFENPGSNK